MTILIDKNLEYHTEKIIALTFILIFFVVWLNLRTIYLFFWTSSSFWRMTFILFSSVFKESSMSIWRWPWTSTKLESEFVWFKKEENKSLYFLFAYSYFWQSHLVYLYLSYLIFILKYLICSIDELFASINLRNLEEWAKAFTQLTFFPFYWKNRWDSKMKIDMKHD